MNFKGTVTIKAPREKVFHHLTTPEALTKCVPGLESMEVIEPGRRFRAVASIGFGAIKARFVTDAEWLNLEPPNRASMKVVGKAPGSVANAMSEMVLSDGEDGATVLDWSTDVTIVGAIASLAARLMGVVTQKLTDSFFQCVRAQIEEP